MYRRPGYAGRSKASADTLCQKCLKRGHYSYECKASAQERPYKPRPSRTQQLLNPQLKPKLTTEVPNDLLRKKGVADEILAKKEEERGRKHGRSSSAGRSRSVSLDSVSTISTNRSPSRSPPPKKRIHDRKSPSQTEETTGKRRRRSVSSASNQSPERAERHTRRRMSSFSPERRGRRRTRSRSSRMDISHDRDSDHDSDRRRVRDHHPRSRNARRTKSGRRSPSLGLDRRPRTQSRSPNRMDTTEDQYGLPRGDGRESSVPRKRRLQSLSRSRSRSPFRRATYGKLRDVRRSPSPYKRQNGRDREEGGRPRFLGRPPAPANQPFSNETLPPRERSLSPYSKRLALTRQMQGGI